MEPISRLPPCESSRPDDFRNVVLFGRATFLTGVIAAQSQQTLKFLLFSPKKSGVKLERNSRKVREIELETPPCPCPSYPCPSCPCPSCPCVSAPVHQLWCISSGASALVHQLWLHQLWCIRSGASALVHQLWCISFRDSALVHQLWWLSSVLLALVHQL